MPLPINGRHQDETVTPNVDDSEVMGRENVTENMAQPHSKATFVRQRSRVEPVEDDSDENTKSLKIQKTNGHYDTGAKSVHFSKKLDQCCNGACGNCELEGIDLRPPENDEEAASLCYNKNEKHDRQRLQKKKRVRKQWLTICTCGLIIFLIASAALGFAVYNHVISGVTDPELGTVFCYPCPLVEAEDIITYNEKYSMCCVGKDAEIRSNTGTRVSPVVAHMKEEKGKPQEVHRVKFTEIAVDVDKSDEGKLGFKMFSSEDKDQFLNLTDPGRTGIMIKESGLYMLTLTLSTNAPQRGTADYRFVSCLRFEKGSYMDDECRKVTLLPKSGDPFDIHKIQNIEKGTIIRATVTDKSLLDSNIVFNKLIIVQLHKQ